MHTIKPLDIKTLDNFSADKKLLVSVEEHSIIGGLGSAIAEYISSKKNTPPLVKIGLPDAFCKAATYDFLLNKYGLTAEKIAERIKSEL